ncbi:MAG: bifunctional (p)ppGpp synthetase/guanosine-3',5'-bis(diphosphate) 3'-pyrophosphohydrolase [Clostridia bacterium]|nr:bifunctional (p)ppGpp synthetase/guanosine-3',5'-bis(diphosphate) 3'-pyrophosphohydrolase [Clostridia bacterium]
MDDLLKKVEKVYSEKNRKLILKAYDFAKSAHQGQYRMSGEEYFTHPCHVAEVLVNLNFDAATIVAALLHDVLEDTNVTDEEMRNEFGDEVLALVEGVTKLDKLQFKSAEDEQAENLRKMFFAMAKDIRVLIIKLADRLHNMRSLSSLPRHRQLAMARETLDIYAPLAGRIGISQIKCELDDLSMKYLYPKEYDELISMVSSKLSERQEFIDTLCDTIREKLKELGIQGDVWGRPKHLYSIYKKMTSKGKTFDQIYDLSAVRVIVDSVKDCYAVLGAIHTIWKPIPGRFKDYIAMPKPNFYQSLHTTVMTKIGVPFEIQIRTKAMHTIAEYGIAAHWRYKEGNSGTNIPDNISNKLGWLKNEVEVQGELENSKEFLDSLKIDLFGDEVFVFSPKGDVINLPVGSTAVDFAYHIHSAIGNKCIGAKINTKIVPLSTELSNGDIVEIITSNSAKGPSRDWLKFVKTAGAKTKIRQFFKREMLEENIKQGKEMLEKEAKRRGYAFSDLAVPSWLNYIMHRYSMASVDDLYASVGYGGLTTNQVLLKLIEFYKQEVESKVVPEFTEANPKRSASGGVLIKGYDDFLIRLAHCCDPVPGDDIVGYISRGRGVTVHRKDCPNVKNMETERLIEARWPESGTNKAFVATVQINTENRGGMLASITTLISNMKVPITSASARVEKADNAVVIISVEITNIATLNEIIAKIRQIPGIINVFRATNG